MMDSLKKPGCYSLRERGVGVLRLLRPKQWVKNAFVLAPLIFSGQFLVPQQFMQGLLMVALFCVASSAVYIVNDWCDIERDRCHPNKSRTRPLASGLVSKPLAAVIIFVLYALLALGAFWAPHGIVVILAYILLNLAYSLALKHQPIIDIFVIAFGFVLRVYAGAMDLHIQVSAWMFITTLCLALYLASIKRRQELTQVGGEGRNVLKHYSVALVDRYAEMSATSALLSYSMFAASSRPTLVLTVPLVLFGMFRYWFVVESLDGGESPTDVLLTDRPLLVTVLIWGAACLWALWPV